MPFNNYSNIMRNYIFLFSICIILMLIMLIPFAIFVTTIVCFIKVDSKVDSKVGGKNIKFISHIPKCRMHIMD